MKRNMIKTRLEKIPEAKGFLVACVLRHRGHDALMAIDKGYDIMMLLYPDVPRKFKSLWYCRFKQRTRFWDGFQEALGYSL